jgi:hypothetical protein
MGVWVKKPFHVPRISQDMTESLRGVRIYVIFRKKISENSPVQFQWAAEF